MKATKFNYDSFYHYIDELKNINDREKYIIKMKSIKSWLEWLLSKNSISNEQYSSSIKTLNKLQLTKFSSNGEKKLSVQKKINPENYLNYKYISITVLLLLSLFSIYTYTKYTSLAKDIRNTQNEGRVLPFKGTIKETDGNPLDTKRDAIFRLYSSSQAVESLYTGKCIGETALEPSFNGSFTILVGSDCGMKPIPEEVFEKNSTLYLGMSIGSDPELKPRYQIFTTTYSKDTSKLQGMELGKSLSSIPYIDETGMIRIDAENPLIKSTNGIFSIEGKSLSLKAEDPKSGDILIQPGSESNVIVPFGKIGIGNFKPTSILDVSGTQLFTSTAAVRNLATPDDENTSVLRLSLGTESSGIKSNFIEFFAKATSEDPGTKVGDIRINNDGVVYETAGADFAEYFSIASEEDIPVGTVISLSSKGIHPSVQNEKIIGAASATAGFIGNRKNSETNSVLIALVGQVNVLVSTINGAIQVGDKIGASSLPGYGAKITQDEFTLGYVLEKNSETIFSNEQCPKTHKNLRDRTGKKIQCGMVKVILNWQ